MNESMAIPTSLIDKQPLKRAVIARADQLSPEARKQIQELSGARPLKFMSTLLINWLAIALIIAVGVWADHWAVTVLCIFLIATRQRIFGLLMHEQVHRLGLRGKYADWIINVLAVYPLFVTTVEDYAKVHLMHHKYFFTDKDPDFIRKSGQEWSFPTSLKNFLRIIYKDLSGLNTFALIRGKTAPKNAEEFNRRNPTPIWLRWAFYAAVALILTLIGGWKIFLIYWVIPILSVTQLLIRWIAVTEHKYNIENGDLLDTTPIIEPKWWQKLLIPDLNFALHTYHHLHAGISFGNLPKVHAIYKKEGLVDESAIFRGQGAYVAWLLGKKASSKTP